MIALETERLILRHFHLLDVIYVNPDDVETYVRSTGVDTLVAAIGTAHGLCPKDRKPKLRLDLLKEIVSSDIISRN
jgi:fructose/tagatose bisphosphate aldolase